MSKVLKCMWCIMFHDCDRLSTGRMRCWSCSRETRRAGKGWCDFDWMK